MNKTDFRQKVRLIYPEQPISFEHNEVQNGATIGEYFFHNMVHSDAVFGVWRGKNIGRATAIEYAANW